MFKDFKLFRRLRGGIWYKVKVDRVGGFFSEHYWTNELAPGEGKITQIEIYGQNYLDIFQEQIDQVNTLKELEKLADLN